MNRKLLLTLTFAVTLFACRAYAAESIDHAGGKECSSCHDFHNNSEYRQLKIKLLNEGKISCFTCHTAASKSGAPDTKQEFTMSRSHHPANGDKECLVCHEIDRRHMNGTLDNWPSITLRDPDPEDSHIYTGGKINDFCLSCHDNSPVTLGDPAETPVDLSSAYEFTGHGKIDINEPCDACHEHHASPDKPYLIKDVINNSPITGNDNSVCFACHSYSSETYPGKSAYLSSEHGIKGKLCVDCHNPHGDNKDLCYLCHNAKYSAHYSTKRDKLCVDCHNPHEKGDLKMTREDEEKLCFQCHKELEREFGNTRDGVSGSYTHHKVDDEEYGGGKVECADCHNPHTVTRMNIVSQNGSSSDMPPTAFSKDTYSYKTDIYDDFCLACHDGSAFSAADIKSELASELNIQSDFSEKLDRNLHFFHKNSGYGCQNCHDAHSTRGTGGIKRGSLLREEINILSWDESERYKDGKDSCGSSGLGVGCH